jgi:hypothetical protein
MNRSPFNPIAKILLSVLAGFLPVAASAHTQVVTLQPGWNAVWLEVEAKIANGGTIAQLARPQEVFTNAAITEVAKPLSQVGTGDYLFEAGQDANSLQSGGWAIWRRSSVVSENTLLRMPGNSAYLVKVSGSAPVTQSVEGEVKFFRPKWKPDTHNLVGFGIDAASPPTFRDFFRYSRAKHPLNNIYALNSDGTWGLVSPSSPMKAGTAYWVFSEGNSDYMGPVAVSFPGDALGELNFGDGDGAVKLLTAESETKEFSLLPMTFTSRYTGAITPRLEKLTPAGTAVTADDLRVYRAVSVPGEAKVILGGAAGSALDLVGSGEQPLVNDETRSLFLAATRVWTTGGKSRTNVYRLVTEISGAKSYVYVPMTATQQGATNATSGDLIVGVQSGLWVGEVLIAEVSSIVEEGAPVKKAAATAPIKVILHSDPAGNVKLLSAVTWMRERTASDEVEAGQVLVLNNAKIPFYEGIEKRDGKIVGRRIETVGYDMPRKTAPADQGDALLTRIVTESQKADSTWTAGRTLYTQNSEVTAAAIASYLQWSPGRPPSLKEEYVSSWPLEGKLNPGNTIKTASASPLRLDPFHRSNPFRHAFHPGHGKGQDIIRSLDFDFDTEQSSLTTLVGTYTETLQGLIGGDLIARGRFTLKRVNGVTTLID